MDLETEDRVIAEFLRSVGPWRKYIVIGGGYAPIIYKLYLADPQLELPPVGTRDIDSLLPRKIPQVSQENISRHLQEAGFIQTFKDLDQPATESYTKEIEGLEIEIEFLTDSDTRHDKHKNVVIAGVIAQPLSYLTLSLQTTTEFRTHSGEIGTVVSPGAWIFHKGLTFPRRKTKFKISKDLYGIWYVASQLGILSEEALSELHFLGSQHPKWFQTLQKNLRHWLESSSPQDWSNLEFQDPSGKLKKLSFERIAKQLLQGI